MVRTSACSEKHSKERLQFLSVITDKTETNNLSTDVLSDVELCDKVQNLVGEISERFVPQPSDELRTTDVILEGISTNYESLPS